MCVCVSESTYIPMLYYYSLPAGAFLLPGVACSAKLAHRSVSTLTFSSTDRHTDRQTDRGFIYV